MKSVLLRNGMRLLAPLLLVFSVFLLLRGHNEPGGGFSGGLVAAASFTLQALAEDVRAARQALRVHPRLLLGIGLGLALLSGIIALLTGEPFLTGKWLGSVHLAENVKISFGTPLLFDLGVFFAVLGATLSIVFSLMTE